MKTKKRIEICGVIGSGKTTLCANTSSLGLNACFENFTQNPFLKYFYEAPKKYALETEITFLLLHYNSIKREICTDLNVCDFSLIQDLAYADINLDEDQKNIFFDLAKYVFDEIRLPDLVVFLRCPSDIVLSRIKNRGRPLESSIDINYIDVLEKAIELQINKFYHSVKILEIDSFLNDFTSSVPLVLKNSIYNI